MESFDELGTEELIPSDSIVVKDYKKTSQKSFLAKASILVLLGTFLSRIFGFAREVVIAAYFGNGIAVDAYRVAYMIPNLLLQLFGWAAIGSAFIPIVTQYLTHKDLKNVEIVANSVANSLMLFFVFSMGLGILFASPFTRLMAPGFIMDKTKFSLTVSMTRVMFPCILFFGLSGFVMGMLHSYNDFTPPAFAPIFFNLIMIACIILLIHIFGPMSLAIGVIGGAFTELLFQIPFLRKKGWRYSFKLAWSHPGVRRVGILILPIVFSLASIEINVFVDTRFASLLASGSIAALHYALRVWYLPIGIFGVTISTVLFPLFSKQTALNDISGLKNYYSTGLRIIFFLMIPTSTLLIVLSKPIIKVLFMRGAFGDDAVATTAYALVFYTLGLTSSCALHLTNRVFYSLKDTLTPTAVTIISIIVNYFGDWILSGPLKHGGIALSTSIVLTFNFICLITILRRRIGRISGRRILNSLIKISIASFFLGIGSFFSWRYLAFHYGGSFLGQIISIITGTFTGTVIYVAIIKILKTRELSIFSNLLIKKGQLGN